MPEIDWVSERAKCSLAQMFERLKSEVERDIAGRNKQLPPNCGFEFRMVNTRQDRFAVLREDPHEAFLNRSILFVLEKAAIRVLDSANNHAEMLRATITFNDLGQCMFKVNEVERESWQLRKDALENLLFQV